MALDPSIILQTRGVQLDNPLDTQNKLAQLQQARNQNRLADITFADNQRERAGENSLSQLLAGGKSGDDVVRGLAEQGFGKSGLAYGKQFLDRQKTTADIDKFKAETAETQAKVMNLAAQQHKDAIGLVNDRETAVGWLQSMYSDPRLKDIVGASGTTVEQAIARIPSDPAGLQKWKMEAALGGDKLIAMTMPDANAKLTAKTSRENNADSNATTQRGQNMTAATAAATLEFNKSQPKGQILQSEEGALLVDPRTGVAQPITSNGQPVQPKLKLIPANVSKGMLANQAALRQVNKAIAELDAYPDAFGSKNYLGDSIRQRSDPRGVIARAYTADIGSLKIHDRSGAAVTASETPRLLPFIPRATDNPETIRKKLLRFKEEYEGIRDDINSTYSRDQGYRTGTLSPANPAAEPAAVPTPALPAGWKVEVY